MNRYKNVRTGAEIKIPSELISPDWVCVDSSEETVKVVPEEEKNSGRGVRKCK